MSGASFSFPPSVPRVLVRSLERRFLWVFLPLLLLPPRMALLLPVLAISAKLGCVNEAGEAVDWWFLYKHPRWTDASHKTCIGDCTGSTYVYSTSASPTSWTVGAHTVFETSSLFGLQLAGVYDGSVTNYVFYNDQLPDGGGSSSSHGHSKGFFAFDETSAFFV